jgi:hypothetical protein
MVFKLQDTLGKYWILPGGELTLRRKQLFSGLLNKKAADIGPDELLTQMYPYTLDIWTAFYEPKFASVCPDESALSAMEIGAREVVVASNAYLRQAFTIEKKIAWSYRHGDEIIPKVTYDVTIHEPIGEEEVLWI